LLNFQKVSEMKREKSKNFLEYNKAAYKKRTPKNNLKTDDSNLHPWYIPDQYSEFEFLSLAGVAFCVIFSALLLVIIFVVTTGFALFSII